MAEELKACPFCHREAQQALCSGLVSCAYEDCPAFLLAVFPENWNSRAQLPSQGGEAVEAECGRLQGLVKMLVRQHMPLEPVDGLDGWSEVISARKAIELRDAALTECERLRASLNDAAKAMHWVQANTPMSKRISASLAKARLAAELSALSAKP